MLVPVPDGPYALAGAAWRFGWLEAAVMNEQRDAREERQFARQPAPKAEADV